MRIPTPTRIIEGERTAGMTSGERSGALIRRPWSRSERAVVLRGYFGRLYLCGAIFLGLALALLVARTDPTRPSDEGMAGLWPIFAVGLLMCSAYAIGILLAPTRALLQTFRPIFIVDGYIRYRAPDVDSPINSNGYIGVLTDEGRVACEWPTIGDRPSPSLTVPALSEFSEFGLCTIDGRPTGALPGLTPRLTVEAPQKGATARSPHRGNL